MEDRCIPKDFLVVSFAIAPDLSDAHPAKVYGYQHRPGKQSLLTTSDGELLSGLTKKRTSSGDTRAYRKGRVETSPSQPASFTWGYWGRHCQPRIGVQHNTLPTPPWSVLTTASEFERRPLTHDTLSHWDAHHDESRFTAVVNTFAMIIARFCSSPGLVREHRYPRCFTTPVCC